MRLISENRQYIDDGKSMIQAMAWFHGLIPSGNKPLPEIKLTQVYVAIMTYIGHTQGANLIFNCCAAFSLLKPIAA